MRADGDRQRDVAEALDPAPYFTRLGAVLYPQRACKRERRSLNACCAGAAAQESTHGRTQSLWHEGAHGERPQHSTAHAVCLSAAAQAATWASPDGRRCEQRRGGDQEDLEQRPADRHDDLQHCPTMGTA